MKIKRTFDSEKYCKALIDIVDCRTAKAIIKGVLSDEKVSNLFKNLEIRKSSFFSLKELVDWCNDYLIDWKIKKITQKELKAIVEPKQEELFSETQLEHADERTQVETVEIILDNTNVTSEVINSSFSKVVNADERDHAIEETSQEEKNIANNATVEIVNTITLDNANVLNEVIVQKEIETKKTIENQEIQAVQTITLDNTNSINEVESPTFSQGIKADETTQGRIYGYARVSTEKQNLNRQLTNLCKYDPTIEIYQEKFSGRKIDNRQEFKKLLARVKKGDTIVFDSVSRMSRNAQEGFKLYKELFSKGISLVFLNESYINTFVYQQSMQAVSCPFYSISSACSDNATEKFINTVCTAIQEYTLSLIERQIVEAFKQAEKEVVDISTRIKQGIRERASKGLPIGNQSKHRERHDKKEKKAKIRALSRAFGGQFTDVQIIEMLHISSITLWKYKAEIKQDIEKE